MSVVYMGLKRVTFFFTKQKLNSSTNKIINGKKRCDIVDYFNMKSETDLKPELAKAVSI